MDYSLADIKAIVDDGDRNEMFGGNAFLWVILIFLFFLGFSGNGLFGNNANGGLAQIERDVLTSSCATQREVLESKYDTSMQLAQLGFQNQMCCCDLKTAIHAEGEATRALITSNTIQELRDQLQAAQLQLGNLAQTQTLIDTIRPVPIPAYITCSPYASTYCGCGC